MNETLVMLQFFSCFIVGQFGEIVFAKINFDEVIAMSDTTGCLGIAYLRQNGAKISLGNVVQGCDIATTLVGNPLYRILATNASESDSHRMIVASRFSKLEMKVQELNLNFQCRGAQRLSKPLALNNAIESKSCVAQLDYQHELVEPKLVKPKHFAQTAAPFV